MQVGKKKKKIKASHNIPILLAVKVASLLSHSLFHSNVALKATKYKRKKKSSRLQHWFSWQRVEAMRLTLVLYTKQTLP